MNKFKGKKSYNFITDKIYLYFEAESITANKIWVNNSEVEFVELEHACWINLRWLKSAFMVTCSYSAL